MEIEMRLSKGGAKLLSLAIFLIALSFYGWSLWSYRTQLQEFTIDTSSIIVLVVSSLLAAIMVMIGGVIWFFLLRDYKVPVYPVAAITVFSVAQFGKYLPGNVGHYFGRVVLARNIGISLSITLSTMVIEMLWGMCVGIGLTLLSLTFFVEGRSLGPYQNIAPVTLGLSTAFLLVTPWLGVGFLNRCFPRLANRLSGGGPMISPRLHTALLVAALFLVSFAIMGLILKLQAQWLFGVTSSSMYELTCLFAAAWLAGYVVPGAPGGLGVREAVIVLLFSPVLGAGAAVGLGVTLRVTTILGDAMAFAIGVLGNKVINSWN
jgi:hypothetical protein